MPPNTVMLAQMMRELSASPGFTESLLAQINRDGKQGPALLTPTLFNYLRNVILGRDWQDLDRFPGWTMNEINPTVHIVGRVANRGVIPVEPIEALTTENLLPFLDLGPYTVEHPATVSLDHPSTLPRFTTEGIVEDLGAGVIRGDGPNPRLAPMHAESQRLADVLNRLSLNSTGEAAAFAVNLDGQTATTPEALIRVLTATGHTVVVSDARYFANFGHFHYKGQDVMMPFWVNAQIAIPGTKRSLLIPVSHAEYEWQVRGPRINADVAFYLAIDGKAQFRVMDTLDQPWVLGRRVHEYHGDDAVEVTRLAGKLIIAYVHLHLAHPILPFGGYYVLGVCQDGVAAIEKKLTGQITLFPNTADSSYFIDPRDAEINSLILAIPKDRNGHPPEPERIFGSLPTTDFNAITIPGLTADLVAVHNVWQDGELERTPSWIRKMTLRLAGAAAFISLIGIVLVRRRRSK